MWQADKSADAAGRLENLKELVRSMEDFENLAGFLEHISLVMERETGEGEQAVNIMTLHSAKGLEFDTVILPGWEEGLFPHQRSLDESGRAGLEEERRLAHVGLTRARKRAKIYFATNRRIHGLWTSTMPSRFLDELPRGACRGDGGRGRRRRLRHVGLRPLALRRDGRVRLQLHDAGGGARRGARARAVTMRRPRTRGRFSEDGQPRYVPDGVFDEDDVGRRTAPHRHLPPCGGGRPPQGRGVASVKEAPHRRP